MIRAILEQTDVRCSCGNLLNLEEPGSETRRWLHCPKCGQYAYLVGEFLCIGHIMEFDKERVRYWQEKADK